MNKEKTVKTSVAIDFKLANVCNQTQNRRNQAAASTSSPSTASFSWSKDEFAVEDADHEIFKLAPIVSVVSLRCLFGSLELRGNKFREFSEMITFSGGHEASPSRPLYGAVNISTIGGGTLVPKWVPSSAGGLTFSFPGTTYNTPANDCQQTIETMQTNGVVSGHWDEGPVGFWYDQAENKIYATHDCWQTILIEGNEGWMDVRYTYPINRLIHGPNGYPFKNDVLTAEATDIVNVQDASGAWMQVSRYRNGTTTTGLLALPRRTELYRVVSLYLIDTRKRYEMPPGWPSDNTYPGGEKGPSKTPGRTQIQQKIFEICFLMPDGTIHVDRFYHPNYYPYENDTSYKPKYGYVEAQFSAEMVDIITTLQINLEAMRNKLPSVYPGIDLTGAV